MSADSKQTGISGLHKLWLVVSLPVLIISSYQLISNTAGSCTTCPTAEQAAYLEEVDDWTKNAQAANDSLIAITKEAAINRDRVLDEEWRQRLRHVLDDMDSINHEMMNVEVPAGALEMHSLLVPGLEATFEANQLLWRGVLAVDTELMNRSNEIRFESARLFREVPSISDFCK